MVPVGWVESPLTDMAQAPMQPDEGAPPAWLVFEAGFADASGDLRPGTEIIVLRVQVDALEALDGTPVIDVKPVLDRTAER